MNYSAQAKPIQFLQPDLLLLCGCAALRVANGYRTSNSQIPFCLAKFPSLLWQFGFVNPSATKPSF